MAILPELDDLSPATTVPHTVHNDAVPDNHDQVEQDKGCKQTDHKVSEHLISCLIDPWKGSLEDEKHPAQHIEEELIDDVLHSDNLVPPLIEIEKNPQHQDARCDHHVDAPVCETTAEN